MTAETQTLATFMTTLASGATTIWTQVGTVCETIVDQPILLFTSVFLLVGGAVGIFGRLISRG